MRVNGLRRRWRKGEVAYGSLVNLRDPAVVEIFGLAGADFVVVDCEHSPTSWETVENMARAADAVDVTCLVRVPDDDPKTILRVLETGVHGIWVPQVESADQARRAAAATRYARRGIRGMHGAVRASRYGALPFARHLRESNREVMCMALVETRPGVEAIEEIVQVSGIDGLVIGPADLAASLGLPGEIGHRRVRAAVAHTVRAARRAGMPVVLAAFAGEADVRALVRAGVTGILFPLSDTVLLTQGARQAVAAGRRLAGRRGGTPGVGARRGRRR